MDSQKLITIIGYFKIIILGLVLAAVATIIYSPHFSYPYPFHGDEWHHITQAILLGLGVPQLNLESGFHLILAGLFKFIDPVLNYKFLPAIWAIFGALALFNLVYKKTARNFYLALLTIFFFGSIKSNVNILGLWFFTPLTFAIPLIYLYIYLFTEGVEKKDRFLLWSSLAIMLLLLPIHAISVLFAIPILISYWLLNLPTIRSRIFDFIPFLIIPPAGLLVLKVLKKLPWSEVWPKLKEMIIFDNDWAMVSVHNSLTEVYSPAGYVLAFIGLIIAIASFRRSQRLLIFVLWPAITLLTIVFFRVFDFSLFSPHQRNLYYFALSLPPLSALGLFSLLNYLVKTLKINPAVKKKLTPMLLIIIIMPIIFFTYRSYNVLPKGFELYQAIDQKDYEAIHYLKTRPNGRVMAKPFLSMAIFPIAPGKIPVTAEYWYQPRFVKDTLDFFGQTSCQEKNELINKHRVKYVLTDRSIACGWELIYSQNNLIYLIR